MNDGTVSEKWTAIHAALVGAAKATLGERKRNDPDWFRESSVELESGLPPEKASTHLKWLESSLSSDKQQFAQARNEAHQAVRAAKNAWFSSKAAQAKQGRFGSKEVWKCIP